MAELSEGQAYKQICALFGGEENVFADVLEVPTVPHIKTPSPSLNRAVGIGGLPRGRFVQFAGKESSGKTLLALTVIAQWQSEDPENCAVFLDAEFTYDPEWSASLGVDNNRVLLVKSNSAADLFAGLVGRSKKNPVSGKITHTKGLLDMAAAGDTISYKNGNGKIFQFNLEKLGIVVLDSIASMQAPTEISSEVGKQNMALLARFLSVELKKITPAVAKANVLMIAINQVRVDLGKMFGNPETSPGGKALKHATSVLVNLGPMFGADNTILDSNKEKMGHKVRAKIGKNKVGAPNKTAEYFIEYTSGVVRVEDELLDIGIKEKVFDRPNNRSYIIDDVKYTSKSEILDFIVSNSEYVDKVIRASYLELDRPIPPEKSKAVGPEDASKLFG